MSATRRHWHSWANSGFFMIQYQFCGKKVGLHGKAAWCKHLGLGAVFDDDCKINHECWRNKLHVFPIIGRTGDHSDLFRESGGKVIPSHNLGDAIDLFLQRWSPVTLKNVSFAKRFCTSSSFSPTNPLQKGVCLQTCFKKKQSIAKRMRFLKKLPLQKGNVYNKPLQKGRYNWKNSLQKECDTLRKDLNCFENSQWKCPIAKWMPQIFGMPHFGKAKPNTGLHAWLKTSSCKEKMYLWLGWWMGMWVWKGEVFLGSK